MLRSYPYVLGSAACVGLAIANATRGHGLALTAITAAAALGGAFAEEPLVRLLLIAAALLLVGWWWGSARLDALDSSILLPHVGEAAPGRLVVSGPARTGGFELRVPAKMVRFGTLRVDEPVLLELPLGRSPPQGAYVDVAARLRLPRPPSHGFDERTWLRRHGVHVVVIAREWRIAGRRGGFGGYADRVRAWLAASLAPGLGGELPVVRPLSPPGGVRPKRRLRRRRRALPRLAPGSAALAGRARRTDGNRLVRACRRCAAVRDPRGNRRCARVARLALGAAA